MRRMLRSCVVCLSLAASLVGCSGSRSSDLSITRKQTGEVFLNTLPTGIAEVHETGVVDLVTQCRTSAATPDCPPVHQTLHVRLLWKQGHTIKDHNRQVSENAALHWYVTPAGRSDGATAPAMVEYHGTGLVRIDRDDQTVTLHIEQSDLRPARVVGAISDPLGATTITGTLVARIDPRQTTAALEELRATVAAARSGGDRQASLAVEP